MEKFAKAFNDRCSQWGGTPLFNQTPFLERRHVVKAFGDRLAIRSNAPALRSGRAHAERVFRQVAYGIAECASSSSTIIRLWPRRSAWPCARLIAPPRSRTRAASLRRSPERSRSHSIYVCSTSACPTARAWRLVRMRESLPALPVVVVSAADDAKSVLAALDLGAMGYIPKTSPRKSSWVR